MKFRIKKTLFILVAITAAVFIFWNVFLLFEKDGPGKDRPLTLKSKFRANLKFSDRDLFDKDIIKTDKDQENLKPEDYEEKDIKSIDCRINDEYTVKCLKSDSTVYIPFPFIERYFEIEGSLTEDTNGKEYFSWQHSYSKVFRPKTKYKFSGEYLWFANYNVESRERVKMVSAIEGVPISTQWDPDGHYYPIQIAQFGLSHYSKNLSLPKPRQLLIEDGHLAQKHWTIDSGESMVKSVKIGDLSPENSVLLVDGKSVFKIERKKAHNDLSFHLRVKPLEDFSFSTILENDKGAQFKLTYSTRNEDTFTEDESIYGFGEKYNQWTSLTRNLGVDLQKAFILSDRKLAVKLKNLHITKVTFNGKAYVDDIRLSSADHESYFRTAVDWFMNNQDDSGGWPIKVTRRLAKNLLILQPGWYSAMAQGQAISLLTRMYKVSRDEKYLEAAKRAVNLYNVKSEKNGIQTSFLDKHIWFEEYPTTPSSYVLNGFMYSLFGLYDLTMACQECSNAEKLFNEGLHSLKEILPLFDTGSGSLYDLRHFSLGIAPNLARWDYHSTHINQLLFLNSVKPNAIFKDTSKRWISYMNGRRAPHN